MPATVVLAVLWTTSTGTSDSLYGWGLPVAVLSAAVVIAGVSGPGARGLLGRALSVPPLRWFGTISYGLYLWHWPVFVVLDAEATGLDGWALTGMRVAVSVAIAVVSLHLVEQPVRSGRRSEAHTSELQSLMRSSDAVFCLKQKKQLKNKYIYIH